PFRLPAALDSSSRSASRSRRHCRHQCPFVPARHNEKMRVLNAKVETDHEEAKDVAVEFLKEKGLLPK
ncbi:hypothetical protein AB9F38_36575, partial [Rhizobium leguminosarum]